MPFFCAIRTFPRCSQQSLAKNAICLSMTQIYCHHSDPSSEVQAHMCVRLLRISKSELLVFPPPTPNLLHPEFFLRSENGNSILPDAQSKNWGIILDSTHTSVNPSENPVGSTFHIYPESTHFSLLPSPQSSPHHLYPRGLQKPPHQSPCSHLRPPMVYSQHSC